MSSTGAETSYADHADVLLGRTGPGFARNPSTRWGRLLAPGLQTMRPKRESVVLRPGSPIVAAPAMTQRLLLRSPARLKRECAAATIETP
jgi:hypothetical protein